MGRSAVLAILCAFAVASCGGTPARYDGEVALKEIAKGDDAKYLKCKDVWKVGQTLPANYTYGCLNGSTVTIEAFLECADGKTRLFVHKDKYGADTEVAISGSKIHAYSKKAYRDAKSTCGV